MIGPGITYAEPSITIKDGQTVLGGTIAITEGGGGPIGGGTFEFQEGPCTSATITGSGGGPIFVCEGSATIRGLTFSDNLISGEGAGINAMGSGYVTIENCCFDDLTADQGGGIAANVVILHVHHCVFSTCHASVGCGGAIMANSASTTIGHCFVIANSAKDSGGGICLDDCPEATVSHCTLAGNRCTEGMGGGLYAVHSANVMVFESSTEANVAPIGGGMAFKACALTTVRDCEITSNVESQKGAGMAVLKESIVTVEACRFKTNVAKRDGGGLFVQQKSVLTLRDSGFELNEGLGDGGAVRIEQESTLDARNGIFHLNHAKEDGGAISLHSSTADLKHLRFTENTVIPVKPKGETNQFGNGAALGCDRCKDVKVHEETLFHSNRASNDGGGFWCMFSTANLDQCTFQSANMAGDDGGGVYITKKSTVYLNRCNIVANESDGDGGGLYVTSSSTATFTGNNGAVFIAQNVSNGGHGGGAYA